MRIDVVEKTVSVYLSRRNLLTLLVKLEQEDSACTLVKDGETHQLVVTSESDDEHYRDRVSPGAVHPATIDKLRELTNLSEEFGYDS